MNKNIQTLAAEMQLGDQAKTFIESDLGKLFISRAELDEQEAKQKLLELDPYSFASLQELQNAVAEIQLNVRVSSRLKSYLADTVINGNQAEHVLDQGEP